MIRRFLLAALLITLVTAPVRLLAARARVLAFYSTDVEGDHVEFAQQALAFLGGLAAKDKFDLQATTQWDDLNAARLKDVDLVLWLDDLPKTPAQRAAFAAYMQHGGGWLGFHIAAYNDAETHWPWFVDFLGGGVFYSNSWPPLPAVLVVDNPHDAVTSGLPERFTSPANEWYTWVPSPRANKDVRVLLTLDASNYPLGFKDVLTSGDLPVVWTNTKYRMIYMNMGHGDKIFTQPVQNRLFENALTSLLHKR